MATTTLDDLRQFGRDEYFDKADVKAQRVMDRVINGAFRLLAQCYDWEHFNSKARINTVAQQSSGTVAVSQGASTVTLTGATWPTALTDYYIRIDDSDIDHAFSARVGTTTGTMATGEVWNDAAVTTGTYVLFKERYSLPSNCRKFGHMTVQDMEWAPMYLSRQEYLAYKLNNIRFTGDPTAITHDSSYIYLWPPPDEAVAIDFAYQRWPTTMSTSTDTMDWLDERIEVVYGLIGIQLQIHDKKLDWHNGMLAARNFCREFADQEPKRNAPDAVMPFCIGGGFSPRHRLEWNGT